MARLRCNITTKRYLSIVEFISYLLFLLLGRNLIADSFVILVTSLGRFVKGIFRIYR